MSSPDQLKSAGLENPVRLTEQQKAGLRSKAMRGLVNVLVAQLLMACGAGLLSGLLGGLDAAWSALLGAATCFVPNVLFALKLILGMMAGKPSNPAGFLFGELVKLASAIALLVFVVYLAQSWLVWPAFIFGLVMVLKGYVLLLMFSKLP